MRLVYERTKEEVQIGDVVTLRNGVTATVARIQKPEKSSLPGRVTLEIKGSERDFYPVAIGAEWIEREDQ